MKKVWVLTVTVALLAAWGIPAHAQGDDAETLREQQKARAADQQGPMSRTPAMVAGDAFTGLDDLLFVGVDDMTVPTWVVDPNDNNMQQAFLGGEVWGAGVIPSATPGDAVVYFNDGSSLFRFQAPGPPTLCCTLMFAAATASVVSVAYDPAAGELLFTRNITTEAVYSLPVTAGACPVVCNLTQDIVYDSANDFGGIAVDPATGIIYGANDGGTPDGIYTINNDGTTTLVVAYPAGETDIDGLAFGDGRLYLVTDEPGDTYVYNLGTASFEAPLTNPWTTSEVFSGAASGTGLLVPVELQTFSIE